MLERTTAEWVQRIEAKGVPCGPINDYAQVFNDPHVLHRGLRVDIPRSDGVTVPGIASPLRLAATPVEYAQAPPALGEHTNRVLSQTLGISTADIAALRERGVL